MNKIFRFKVGDIVVQRAELEQFRAAHTYGLSRFDTEGKVIFPRAFLVCERILQQCHGGTQLQLNVRDSNGVVGMLLEHGCASYDEVVNMMNDWGNTLQNKMQDQIDYLTQQLNTLAKAIKKEKDENKAVESDG